MDVNIAFLSRTGKRPLKTAVPDDTPAEFRIREAVRLATLRDANLSRANLSYANLSRVDLR